MVQTATLKGPQQAQLGLNFLLRFQGSRALTAALFNVYRHLGELQDRNPE